MASTWNGTATNELISGDALVDGATVTGGWSMTGDIDAGNRMITKAVIQSVTNFGGSGYCGDLSVYASNQCPPKSAMAGPYSDGTYYYAVRNMSSRLGNTRGRTVFTNGSYELYEKPSASNTKVSNYTQLTRSVDTSDLTIYNVPYTMKTGGWVTTVNVTVSTGWANYVFPVGSQTGSYGRNFYVDIIAPWLPCRCC